MIQNDKDPLRLLGLTQATFVLQCLEKGQSQKEIAEKFEGDSQLVKMWTNFLVHNHWIEKVVGKWRVTEKAKPWVKTIEDKFSN